MKLTTLLTTQPAYGTGVTCTTGRGVVGRVRPIASRAVTTLAGTRIAGTPITGTGNVPAASWSAIARKQMLVPSFHDRWPLRSTT